VAGRYGLERQFLHARRLTFDHPVTGEPVDVTSPLPADLRAALEVAERMSVG
jgi:23S rRNA pseudouridine1911/1915/1917 synthase